MSDLVEKKFRSCEIYLELLQISNSDTTPIDDEDRRSFLDEKVKPRVRELGEELNKLGGLSLMSFVCESMPYYDVRLLEVAWHGIGMWSY